MTPESYFEMCEALGTEPKEEEIPPTLDDFPAEVHTALLIYNNLRDIVEPMSGVFMGKDLSTVEILFRLYNVEDYEQQFCLETIRTVNSIRSNIMKNKKPSSPKA